MPVPQLAGQGADAVILEQCRQCAIIHVRIDQTLRGKIERVADRHEIGKRSAQSRCIVIIERRQLKLKLLRQIERECLERAGLAQHRRAATRQRRAARSDFGNVAQLFERLSHNHAGALHLGAHQLVVASHGTGMRCGRFTRGAALAGVQQCDQLAGFSGLIHQGEEAGRIAELLNDHRDDPRLLVRDHEFDIILDTAAGLIAGRNGVSQVERTALQHHCEHGRHGAALRDDADATGARRLHVRINEGERNAIEIVHRPQAVRPLNHHAGLMRDATDLLLIGNPLLATLGKACSKEDCCTGFARSKLAHGIEHGDARNGQDGAINVLRQRFYAWYRRAAADRFALGIDEVNVAGKFVAHQIGQHARAKRAGRFRCTNNCDRPRTQQAIDVTRSRLRALSGFNRHNSTLLCETSLWSAAKQGRIRPLAPKPEWLGANEATHALVLS